MLRVSGFLIWCVYHCTQSIHIKPNSIVGQSYFFTPFIFVLFLARSLEASQPQLDVRTKFLEEKTWEKYKQSVSKH